MRNRARLAIAAICLSLLSVGPLKAEPPASAIEGSWLTDDRKGVVGIFACGDKLCGRIAQVLDRTPGVPTTDVNNPDKRLRSRPLVGLLTLWGFSRRGAVWDGGRAYDPKSELFGPVYLTLTKTEEIRPRTTRGHPWPRPGPHR